MLTNGHDFAQRWKVVLNSAVKAIELILTFPVIIGNIGTAVTLLLFHTIMIKIKSNYFSFNYLHFQEECQSFGRRHDFKNSI